MEDLSGRIGQAFDRGVLAYHDDPAGFARDCIMWPKGRRTGKLGGPLSYQEECMQALVEHGRVAVRGPRKLGKSAQMSWIILWFALTRDAAQEDWKVIVTNASWYQLTAYLWREVETKWAPKLNWEKIGRGPFDSNTELMRRELRLRYGAVTLAAPTDSGKIEGAHADELLYVFDESKLIPDTTWDSIEGSFAGVGPDSDVSAYVIASSTPGGKQGRFYDVHTGKAGKKWHAIHVPLERLLQAGQATAEYVEESEELFGKDSAKFQNDVLGEFATQSEDAVISLAHLEEAHDRWEQLELRVSTSLIVPVHDSLGPLEIIGADVAGRGEDRTVYALRHGKVISAILVRPHEPDTSLLTDELERLARTPERGARIVIDAIGLGEPIANELRKRGCNVVDFIASQGCQLRTRGGQMGFDRVRAAAWWNLREMLEPGSGYELAIPPDEQLTADLIAPRWTEVAGGKLAVEKKDDIRKRLKRSTDSGDACFVGGTLIATEHGEAPVEEVHVGMHVWTRQGLRPVLACGPTKRDAPVVTVELEDGRSLTGTGNHPVWDGEGFRALDTFVQADIMWVCGESVWSTGGMSSRATPTATVATSGFTSGRLRPSASGAWVRFTSRCTGLRSARSPTGGTFTTRTKTRSTTSRGISKRFPQAIMRLTMSLSMAVGEISAKSTWIGCESLQKRGTPPRRDSHGTQRTDAKHGRVARSSLRACASVAASPSSPSAQTGRDGAGALVRAMSVGITQTAIRMCRRRVESAAKTSPARTTGVPSIAPVSVRRVLANARSENVWNLSVAECPEYFANGILVHNCVQAFFLNRIAPTVAAPQVLRRKGGSRLAPLRQRAGRAA